MMSRGMGGDCCLFANRTPFRLASGRSLWRDEEHQNMHFLFDAHFLEWGIITFMEKYYCFFLGRVIHS